MSSKQLGFQGIFFHFEKTYIKKYILQLQTVISSPTKLC